MTTTNTAAPLVGTIIAWPTVEGEDGDIHRFSGRGEIVAHVESIFLLVRTIARDGDAEPPFMFLMDMTETGLHFFANLQDEERWFDWVTSPSEEIDAIADRWGKTRH